MSVVASLRFRIAVSDSDAREPIELEPFVTPISGVVEAIRRGEFVILIDDNSGGPCVLTVAAEKATLEQIVFMIRRGGGIVTVPLPRERLQRLQLPLMVSTGPQHDRTPFTVAVDAAYGVSTGISASDRLQTIHTLIDPRAGPDDLVRPGHVYPLQYTEGGVLRRAGFTEAAVDLMKYANLEPAAVLTDLIDDNGALMTSEQMVEFAHGNGVPICRIVDIIALRRATEQLFFRGSEFALSLQGVRFKGVCYQSMEDDTEHIALVLGDVHRGEDILVRLHRECVFGDVFGVDTCNCSRKLRDSIDRIREEGAGVVLYRRSGGNVRFAAICNHDGEMAVSCDGRQSQPDHTIERQILSDLGARSIRLLADHTEKFPWKESHGVRISGYLAV